MAILGRCPYAAHVKKTVTLLAAARHERERIPAPPVDVVMDGEPFLLEGIDPSGWFLVTSTGFGFLAIPWDETTWRGVAMGALTGGLAGGMANPIARAATDAIGSHLGSEVVESQERRRLRDALHGKNSFSAPMISIVGVTCTTGWRLPKLEITVEDDDGTRRTKAVYLKGKDAQVIQAAEAIAQGRAACEAQALWKLTAADFIGAPDHPALDVTKPLTEEALAAVKAAGFTVQQVSEQAQARYARLAGDFATCPEAAQLFVDMMR